MIDLSLLTMEQRMKEFFCAEHPLKMQGQE